MSLDRVHLCPVRVDRPSSDNAPTGWQWAKLTDVARLESGHTPSRRVPEYWDGSIPWLSLKDIRSLDGPYIFDTHDHPTEAGIANSSARLLPKGTVALCRTASVGKVVILGKEMATSQDFVNWVCGPGLLPEYLFAALTNSGHEFDRLKQGTTHKTIYMPVSERFHVLLPPMSTQRRIAAVLDRADAIRRQRQEAIRLTDEFLRSAFLEMFGDPVTNPKGWPTAPMGDLATFVGGGTPSRDRPDFFSGKICWATSKDMKGEHLWDTEEHITEDAIRCSATKLVAPGALLVVVKSKVLMHTLPVLLAHIPTCFGQDLKAVTSFTDLTARYLARHLRIGASALLSLARGANTEGLTLDHLRNYKVMVPPAYLLHRHEKIELAVETGLTRQVAAGRETQSLFEALVYRAFQGRL